MNYNYYDVVYFADEMLMAVIMEAKYVLVVWKYKDDHA